MSRAKTARAPAERAVILILDWFGCVPQEWTKDEDQAGLAMSLRGMRTDELNE